MGDAVDDLRAIRQMKDLKLRSSPYISGLIRSFDGTIGPCEVRNYQAIGVLHIAKMASFVIGDEPGLGKTLQVLYGYAMLRHFYPDMKMLWVGPLSSLPEKEDEVQVMLRQTRVRFVEGTPAKRVTAWEQIRMGGIEVALVNYNTLLSDYTQIEKCYAGVPFIVVFDEAHRFGNPQTKTWRVCSRLARLAQRRVGLTATLIRNRLMEAYGVFRVIVPPLFPNKAWFEANYCEFQQLKFGKGRNAKRFQKLAGYKNLPHFRRLISPYFIARTPEDVNDELPELVWNPVELEMSAKQRSLYNECVLGLLKRQMVDPLTGDEYSDYVKGPLRVLMNTMLLTNSPQMLPEFAALTELSSKEQWILEKLDGELSQEKVVIFTFFKKWALRLQELIKKELKFQPMLVVGGMKPADREAVKTQFNHHPTSDLDSNVVIITAAGKEAINLTASRHLIFGNMPWSYGDLRQLVGRIRRQGSKHESVVAHLLKNAGTVDETVYDKLRSKQSLSQVLINDSLESLEATSAMDDIVDIVEMMRAGVK